MISTCSQISQDDDVSCRGGFGVRDNNVDMAVHGGGGNNVVGRDVHDKVEKLPIENGSQIPFEHPYGIEPATRTSQPCSSRQPEKPRRSRLQQIMRGGQNC